MPFEDSGNDINNRSSDLAHNASRLLSGAGADFFYELIYRRLEMNITGESTTSPVTSLNIVLQIGPNSTVEFLKGSRFVSSRQVQTSVNLKTIGDLIR